MSFLSKACGSGSFSCSGSGGLFSGNADSGGGMLASGTFSGLVESVQRPAVQTPEAQSVPARQGGSGIKEQFIKKKRRRARKRAVCRKYVKGLDRIANATEWLCVSSTTTAASTTSSFPPPADFFVALLLIKFWRILRKVDQFMSGTRRHAFFARCLHSTQDDMYTFVILQNHFASQ